MKFIELFAGIGGFRYGLEICNKSIGLSTAQEMEILQNKSCIDESGVWRSKTFTCVWANEIDKYACQIYRKNYGDKELYEGDITKVEARSIPDHDLLVGGFPCQAFSIAGKRGGFDDTRGTLFFEIARIVREKQPRLLLLENVKGLLSHDKGRTFATILSTLDGLGYDAEWQVFNSKDFQVPQNRERTLIVGHLRGRGGRKVFPIEGSNGKSCQIYGRIQSIKGHDYLKRCYSINGSAPTLPTGVGGNHEAKIAIPVLTPNRPEKRQNGRRFKNDGEPSFTLTAQDRHGVYDGIRIRRLTPKECERLQAFQDDWTKEISDSQRYKCLGNAVTTNVIAAIGYELKKQTKQEKKTMKIEAVNIASVQEGLNPRQDFSKVGEIADSIKRIGLLQPIIVRETENPGQYVLLDGACRLRASQKLGSNTIQAYIVDQDQEQSEEIVLSANLMRSDLNILEKSRGFSDLIKSFPEKYNKTTLAKTFGVSPKVAAKMIKIGNKLPREADSILSKSIGTIGLDELEQIAQIPVDWMPKLMIAWQAKEPYDDFDDVMRDAFHNLDYMEDAFNTGMLISEGKAFLIKNGKSEYVYTSDEAVYKKVKADWEKSRSTQYGSGQDKQKKLSEKEKEKIKNQRAAERKARAEAIDQIPDLITRYLAVKPSPSMFDKLGEEICRNHLSAEKCRRLDAIFGLKDDEQHAFDRARIWKQLFSKLCITPESLVLLHGFLSNVDEKEQNWTSFFSKFVSKAEEK